MKYLVSVDGGGTKTQFSVSDLQGNIVTDIRVGSSNYKSVGIDETYKNIKSGFDKLFKDINITQKDIKCCVFGISGCDCEDDHNTLMDIILSVGIDKEKVHLYNDGVLAFYARADSPGIVVIAGTGSIVLGIDKESNIFRAGGWGYNFSDLGSGYDIGRQVLKEVLLYCDKCREHSKVFDDILKHFKINDFNKLPYKITGISNNFEISEVASLVVKAAIEGDELSEKILNHSSKELAILANSLINNVSKGINEEINVVLSGGVFNSELYRSLLIKNLNKISDNKYMKFLHQVNEPVYGGIRLANKLVKGEIL